MMVVTGEDPPRSKHILMWWLIFVGVFVGMGFLLQLINFFVLVGWVGE